MSTLLAESPVVELRRPRVDMPLCQPTPAAASADPLLQQVRRFLHEAGLSKVDMFIFIAVYALAILLVIVMGFAARFGHGTAWAWGLHLMNVPLALAGLSLLVASILATGAALHWASRPRRWPVVCALGLAALCCMGFVATILIDFDAKWNHGIRPGAWFHPSDRYAARRFGVKLPKKPPTGSDVAQFPVDAPIARSVSAVSGRRLFLGTCMSCHGSRGEGLPGQGKSLIANEFVGGLDEAKLLSFVKVGRQPWDPLNTTKVQMPPRGGNPMLSDDDLRDIVAYVRTLQTAAPSTSAPSTTDAAAPPLAGRSLGGSPGTLTTSAIEEIDPSLLVPRWVVSPPPPGSAGFSREYLAEMNRPNWKSPRDGVVYVNAYYTAAQFGGLHAGAVAMVLTALFVQALRGRITADRRAPLALATAGCVVMTLAWLLVFPNVYMF